MSILNSPRNNIAAMIHHTRRILRDQNVRGKMDTLDAVAHEVKVGRNTLARIRANPNYSVKQRLERDIARAAFRMFEYPWSLPAERLCQEIRIAILERQGESFENDPVRSKWGFLIGEGTIGRLRAEPERAELGENGGRLGSSDIGVSLPGSVYAFKSPEKRKPNSRRTIHSISSAIDSSTGSAPIRTTCGLFSLSSTFYPI